MRSEHLNGRVVLHGGDSRDVLKGLADCSIDSVVTDPPYSLVSVVQRFGNSPRSEKTENTENPYGRTGRGFMGHRWDTGETAFATTFWAEIMRVLKPGGHVVAFSGTRTYHRLAVAIEDAGFEIRDQLAWCYGQGFPKSHNISRNLDGIRCLGEGCEAAQSVLQHYVRPVRDTHVPQAECYVEERGEVLLSCLPKQGASATGRTQPSCDAGLDEPCMEGRSDASQKTRKLRKRAVRALSAGSDEHGTSGRVRDGASDCDGATSESTVAAGGVRASSGSQAAQQRGGELGTVAGQSQSQDGRAWPHCDRCGKPIVPDGLGTALKPSWEPIVMARKPLVGTVAANVLEYKTGALNIDGCRVEGNPEPTRFDPAKHGHDGWRMDATGEHCAANASPLGRWPANIVHDGSDEVVSCFPDAKSGGNVSGNEPSTVTADIYGDFNGRVPFAGHGDSGSAARFFYSAKADKQDRIGSKHPTVKPVDLMQWLCRLVTPPGGTVLDPFAGSGSTGEAAWREGFRCVLIEREPEYQADIAERLRLADKGPLERKKLAIKQAPDAGPLFGANDNAPPRTEASDRANRAQALAAGCLNTMAANQNSSSETIIDAA